MAINEAVNIGINVDGTASVQQASNAYEDLGDAVAKTQLEAEKLAQQFGINDARTQEAIKTAGKYKQQMEQLDFAIDAAKGGSDQLFRATQGVVAGFEVAAGAMALFGSESEELQKILIKVQGAMALSQGLKDLNEFSPAIKNVASAFSGILTKAVQGFSKASKAAMAATGIGLLVVAVASLVEYWDDIKEAVNGVSSEQKDLVKEQQKSADLASKQLDNISAQENILKQQGKTEEDILKMKIAATKNAITALEAQLTTQQEMKKSQIDAAKRNKAILQGIIQFISLPLTGLLMTVDAVGKAFGKDFGLNEKFSGGLASLVFDPKAVEEEADKTIQTTQDNLNKLKNSVAGYEMQVTQVRKDNLQKQRDASNKAFEDEVKKLDEQYKIRQTKINQDYANGLISKDQQEIQLLQLEEKRLNAQLDLAQKNKKSTTEIDAAIVANKIALNEKSVKSTQMTEDEILKFKKEAHDKELQGLDEFYKKKELKLKQDYANGLITKQQFDTQSLELERQRLANALQIAKDNGQSTTEIEAQIAENKINIDDNVKASKQSVADLEQQIFDNSQALANAVISLAGEQSKIGKAVALASIAADTAKALSGALSNANNPASPDNIATGGLAAIPKYIALATTILTNSKRAYDIIKAPAPSGATASGGGASLAAATSVPTFQAPSVRLGVQGEQFTQVNRVYVTEADISGTQNRVKVTEGISTI
jgi:hypothetical protein